MSSLEKCCFIVPRRWGLMAISYIRIVAALFVIGILIDDMIGSQQDPQNANSKLFRRLSICSYFIVDIIFCTVFIMALTKNHLKLHKVFFHYSIALAFFTLVVTIIYYVTWDHSLMTINHSRFGTTKEIPYEVSIMCTTTIILIQLYIILLIRSEMLKIRKTQYWNPRTGRNVLM